MKQQKPILHARDHLPGGADPLPGLPSAPPPPPPIDTTIPTEGEPPVDPPGSDEWHWWRFLDVSKTPPESTFHTPDTVTGDPVYRMTFVYYQAHVPLIDNELFPGRAGPNGDSVSLLRLRNLPENPPNYFEGSSPVSLEWGLGGHFTLFGWFNFVGLHNWDIYNFTHATRPTYLLLNGNGSVTLHRDGNNFTSAPGLIQTGVWAQIGIIVGHGRVRVYVNPGPPEPVAYNPAYGADFPLQVPMAMETWGLALGDYTAAQLANRLTTNGFASVALRLNPPSAELPPGMTHADYITQTAADVATLQAAGLQVVGWGVADGTTGADLTATGVNGWMPQIEGPGQYASCMAALAAGVGASLPKAVVSNFGGLEDPADVAALAAAGIDAVAVEAYAEVPGHNNLTGMLWQATQQGFAASKVIAMLGTYRGETPEDYTGLDENVLPNYGIYNAPQTSEAGWAAFGEFNKGTLMLSAAVIDEPDPATATNTGPFSIGSSNTFPVSHGADGAFEGYVAEVVVYDHALTSGDMRAQYLSGSYGDTGTVPPNEGIPSGSIKPSQLAPGGPGQHLSAVGGVAAWTDQLLDDNADVDTTGVADTDVLAYDAATSKWVAAAAGGGGGGGGEEWFTGSGAPSGSLGVVGDWYLDSVSGDYYEKTGASSWTLRGNLQGPAGAAGATGPTGPTGAAGADGERWFTGSGAPAGTLAGSAIGDWYLDSVSGDYYEKTGASSWTLRGNLQGPAGSGGGGGSTVKDKLWTPPTTPHSGDDEFNDSTIDAAWANVTPSGTVTWTEDADVLSARFVGQSGNQICVKVRPITITLGGYIETALRLLNSTSNYIMAGLVFTDGISASSNAATALFYIDTGNFAYQGVPLGGTINSLGGGGGNFRLLGMAIHVRLVWQAANTWRMLFSPDGVSWSTLGVSDLSKSMTPTQMGVFVTSWGTGGPDRVATFEYFRCSG